MKNWLKVILDFGSVRYQVGDLFYSEIMGKYAFSYNDQFLALGIEISPKVMPLSRDTYTSERDNDQYDIHGVFADSLPDAWGRLVQDVEFEKINIHNANTLDRLAFVGTHCIGALCYEPSRQFEKGNEIVALSELRKAMQGIYSGDIESISEELLQIGGSAGGAHPKFLVDLNTSNGAEIRYSTGNTADNWVPVLLKIPKEIDLWQRVEYCYCQMAKDSGIDIPSTYLIFSKTGKANFAIERFDILENGERLHVHSYAGIDGFSFRRDNRDYLDLLRMISTLTQDHRHVIEGYRRMVFNFLGGNEDDHGKNFCFLMDPKGIWSLSPAFDLGYSDNGGIHRLSVNGKRSALRVQDLEHTAIKFQIKEWKEITKIVIDSLRNWEFYAIKNKVPQSMIKKIGEKMAFNIKRIEKEL